MVKYLYDDDDEEEILDFYDEDPDDPYPQVIIEINEEQMMKLYDKAKEKSKCQINGKV